MLCRKAWFCCQRKQNWIKSSHPFSCEPKVDEDDDDVRIVDIRVMIDPLKDLNDKINIDIKTFPGIKSLTSAGLRVLKLC